MSESSPASPHDMSTRATIPPRTRRSGASRAVAMLILALVALAGLGIGIAIDRAVLLPRRYAATRGRGSGRFGGGPPEGRGGAPRLAARLAKELDLTPAQTARVDSILTRQMVELEAVRRTMQPRFDSLVAHGHAEIDSVLTPAQRDKLHALTAEREKNGRGHRPPL